MGAAFLIGIHAYAHGCSLPHWHTCTCAWVQRSSLAYTCAWVQPSSLAYMHMCMGAAFLIGIHAHAHGCSLPHWHTCTCAWVQPSSLAYTCAWVQPSSLAYMHMSMGLPHWHTYTC